jgi:hypothetical protein
MLFEFILSLLDLSPEEVAGTSFYIEQLFDINFWQQYLLQALDRSNYSYIQFLTETTHNITRH